MQTILVKVNQHGEKTALQIDGKAIAAITKDIFNKGRYFGISAAVITNVIRMLWSS